MSETNVPKASNGSETIIGGVIAIALIGVIAFCCYGRSKDSSDYESSYTPSASGSATASSSSLSFPSQTPTSLSRAVVISENVNLRKLGSSTSEIIQTIPQGTNLEVVKQQNAWFLVKSDGKSGWVHGNTIRLMDSTQNYSDLSSRPGSGYKRTTPDYDPNAPLMPRHEGDIEPLYNEVQRLKEQKGMTDAEAVDKLLRDAGEIP